jgi:hypothetical protein
MEQTNEKRVLKLSDQALGAVMLALQQSLLNQSDIVPVLKSFELLDTVDGLQVSNPPVFDMTDENNNESSAVFDALVDAIE